MIASVEQWARGELTPTDFDSLVDRGRAAWARLIGVDVSTVAAGLAASHFVGMVAASLPDGARVLAAEGDFTSVLFPMLVQSSRGVTVDIRPLVDLPDADGSYDLVAVS